MKTEVKTAIVMAIVIIIGIGGANAYFSSLEVPKASSNQNPPNTDSSASAITKPSIISSIDKSKFRKAPELSGIAGYINTTPEELKAAMKDKVVLYDIWTYSCINCQRTLPYITAWNDKIGRAHV